MLAWSTVTHQNDVDKFNGGKSYQLKIMTKKNIHGDINHAMH